MVGTAERKVRSTSKIPTKSFSSNFSGAFQWPVRWDCWDESVNFGTRTKQAVWFLGAAQSVLLLRKFRADSEQWQLMMFATHASSPGGSLIIINDRTLNRVTRQKKCSTLDTQRRTCTKSVFLIGGGFTELMRECALMCNLKRATGDYLWKKLGSFCVSVSRWFNAHQWMFTVLVMMQNYDLI